jgi:ABC-type antimicrobial peptide transport system permease subunit
MKNINIRRISFKSYLKFYILSLVSMGIVFGLIFFGLSLVGVKVTARVFNLNFTGIMAGVVNLILAPVIMLIFALFFGALSFLPFRLYLEYAKKIKLKGEFSEN